MDNNIIKAELLREIIEKQNFIINEMKEIKEILQRREQKAAANQTSKQTA